ncbi:transient receptor potential cation channel subfamily A member 1 isoform X3 [Halyomorpha halys]|uniref:transient receptor potential cation channel subfamily A member 1 isoform X3 n=1 Tax=Halyomorpha halys TaxID=286706 RepID=UPI0034D26D8C
MPAFQADQLPASVCRNDRRRKWTKGAALLSFLTPPTARNHEVSDGKDSEIGPPIEGEVCLLTDSPFRILRAAESGNLEDFNRLFLAEPERLNVRDSKGRAAAHQAAARNKINILQFIANHAGDLNVKDHHGNSPLHIAVEHESLEAIDFLFQFGVDANVLNEKNQAVIHLATELNKPKVLLAIASYKDKIDVNQGGEHGRTALHLAAIYDHDECARILITDLKACLRKPCHNGYYPIHEAAKNASSRTMEVFLQWGEERGCTRDEMISFYDSEGNVPLHSAVHSGDFKAVELCLRSGAKISTQQHDLSTPVHLACAQGALDIVKLMFGLQPAEKPTCLNSCDVQKMTPLHCAAMFDRAEIVQYLIGEGADINALDKEKRSPLLLAGSRGGWRTVLTLIGLKANIQLKDSNDRNVLHLVVMNGGRLDEFAEAVIKAQSKERLQELLNEKDRFGCSPLHHASREGHIKSLENLIKLGAVINLKNNHNESPLHFAARYGRYNTVKQLLDSEKGSFIINETDGEGLTPLHIASQQGHTRVVSLLLNRGALLHRDHNGRNPLHLAAMSGYTQTMELLHSVHSHLLDQVDKDGNTALHLATMENKPNSIALLLSMNCKLLYNTIDLSAIDYAIYYKFPEAALAMVTHDTRGQEVMTLRSDKHPCVTLALIASMPRVFESVQDKCITKANCKKDSKSFYIKYSFSCLLCPKCLPCNIDSKVSESFNQQATMPLPALNIKYNFQNYQRSAKENAAIRKFQPSWKPQPLIVVNAMVQHGRVELLAHPLSQKYLQMKWNSYGKYFHMFHLLFYLIFLVFVTMYSSHILSVSRCFPENSTETTENTTVLFMTSLKCIEKQTTNLEYFSSSAILLYVAVNALREMHQLLQQRWQYLMDPTNLASWMLYLSATLMVLPLSAEQIQVPCAAITVFLSWFTLLLNLQRFDLVGIYVVMFLEILQTLIKVLIVFSILIIAFGLAFFILLSRGGHISFSTIPMSLMRTFSMMLGEIDFLGTYVHPLADDGDDETPSLPFPFTAFIVLGLFMVLMPILLMNLLIGLAVGDIESVRRNAQLKRLAMQVVLHTELERKLPQVLLERIDKMELIEYPNDKCKLGFLDHLLRMWFFNPFSEDGLEMVLENNEDLVTEEITKMKRKLKDITKILDSQGQLLKLIVQKMEIKTEADEVDEGVSPRELESGPGGGSKWTSPRVRNKLRTALSFSKAHPIK